MSSDLKGYRVFIASPGGLEAERRVFKETVEQYNEFDAVERNALFLPIGWELALGGLARPQEIINRDIKRCDYFVLLLWDRWGTPPTADPDPQFTSGTEEEFHVALECIADESLPMRQIVVAFKGVDSRMLTDPGPQLHKVLEFRKKLEAERSLLFHTFDQPQELSSVLRRHLASWTRSHEQGDVGKVLIQKVSEPRVSRIGEDNDQGVETIRKILKRAGNLAKHGDFTEAETLYAKALLQKESAEVLFKYGLFLVGRLRYNHAELMFEKLKFIGEHQGSTIARIWSAQGFATLERKRGNYDLVELYQLGALRIAEEGEYSRMAAECCRNLGLGYLFGEIYNEAIPTLSRAVRLARKAKSAWDEALSLLYLGRAFYELGRKRAADRVWRKALTLAQDNDIDLITRAVVREPRPNFDDAMFIESNEDGQLLSLPILGRTKNWKVKNFAVTRFQTEIEPILLTGPRNRSGQANPKVTWEPLPNTERHASDMTDTSASLDKDYDPFLDV